MRFLRRSPIAALCAAVLGGAGAPAASASPITFLQGEQTITVERPGTSSADALNALLAGPTAAETASGVRTYVPAGTKVRSLMVESGVAKVDLSLEFAGGDDPDSLRARLTQLVDTLTGPEGTQGVQVRIAGGVPLGMFPGVAMTATLTPAYLAAPTVNAPKTSTAPTTKATTKSATSTVEGAQERLAELGYLLSGDVDGRYGPVTQAATIAFQKWEGLKRTGQLDGATRSRLSRASRPTPRLKAPGTRAEVLLQKQVALAIKDNKVVRVLHVSTGAAATPTPAGHFTVYARIAKWWSVPFSEWLLWALPFNGGIAFHQLADVPVYPASHGCVRLTAAQAKWMYDFLGVGNSVDVIASA